MAGPSLSGPLTPGWTAARLTPAAAVAAATPSVIPAASAPIPANTAPPVLDLGRVGGVNPRAVTPKGTPLEQLLTAIFPGAADDFSGTTGDSRQSGAPPSILNNILGNLGLGVSSSGAAPTAAAPAAAPAGGTGAQIASTIPGAPSFLAGSINQVQNPGALSPGGATSNVAAGNLFTGLAALAAEQRMQEAQAAQEQQAALESFQQQQLQRSQQQFAQNQLNRLRSSVPGWGPLGRFNQALIGITRPNVTRRVGSVSPGFSTSGWY